MEMMMNTGDCECTTRESAKLPVNGLCLDVDPSALGCLSRQEIQEMIDRSLTHNPGGGMVPDLRFDQETLWPVRYEGKQVYARLFDFGQLANTNYRNVTHNIPDIDWIGVSEDYSYVTLNEVEHYNLSHAATVASNCWFWVVSPTQVRMRSGINRTNCRAVFCLLYTKLSDPVID